MKTTLDQAILEALRTTSGYVSIMKVEGGYDSFVTITIPAEEQDDIILTFKDPAEIVGYEVPVKDCDDDFLLTYINEVIIPDLDK